MSASENTTKRLVLLEALPLLLLILVCIRTLYEFRTVPWIGRYLSTLVALTLVYPPVIHTTLRSLSFHFFERNTKEVTKSFQFFLLTTLAIFPLFLLLNHFYQTLIFSRQLTASIWSGLPPPEILLVQIFLVAFPEEFFFRGYLQTLVSRLWHRKLHLFGSQTFSVSPAVPLTSFLFAFSHSIIALQWWHFAIFFPSLVFGWLREKTGGLVAPILFHATSNIVVYWIGNSYR